RAKEKMEKLSRYDPRLSAAEVIFDCESHTKRAEAILSVDGGDPVVARGEGSEFRESLDQLIDRLSKIVRRRRSQIKDHQGPKLSDVVAPEALIPEE
ncbi:MAG: HPF/RaiA family ribosome-associated protein, partial [Gemmatimonadota bacterium]